MGKLQILNLRTRYRSKLGWFFSFGLIHVMICRNLVRYMGNPRSDGLFGGILLAGRAEDDEAGQINAEVPRSQMGAAERKRRRELAKERGI